VKQDRKGRKVKPDRKVKPVPRGLRVLKVKPDHPVRKVKPVPKGRRGLRVRKVKPDHPDHRVSPARKDYPVPLALEVP
jgi:hypothetical protein